MSAQFFLPTVKRPSDSCHPYTQEKMVELRKAVEKLQDFQIDCGPVHADTPDETISIEWTDDVSDINEG